MNRLQSELDVKLESERELRIALVTKEDEADAMTSELDQLRARVGELEGQRDSLSSRIGSLVADLERREAVLRELIANKDKVPTPSLFSLIYSLFSLATHHKRNSRETDSIPAISS